MGAGVLVVSFAICSATSAPSRSRAYIGGGGGRGLFFLWCHVQAGGGRTIQIDSRGSEAAEDDERHSVSWSDVASLRCDGSPACVRELADRRSVAFQVRRRRKLMGRTVGSELVGRAEVPWRDVIAAAVAVERRVALAAPARGSGGVGGMVAGRDVDDAAAPVMSVRMSVRVSETAAPARRRSVECAAAAHRETCGCEWIAGDEDVFGVVTCGVADDAFE